MGKNLFLISCFLLCLSWEKALADDNKNPKSASEISKEDMEIINTMEILNLMEILDNMDLLRNTDILIEDKNNEDTN